ncbi:MAG TPA: alpha/beta hydrolase [Flavobacteriaceae bacterium]|nr:alpha/beta hydrolase [Flavobacteriaceae bacterium]
MIQKNCVLTREGRKPILYDIFSVEGNEPKPLLIFSHGYKGFKDWGAWDLVGKSFVEHGINFLKFNFSHNGGTIENPIDFPDLESFANNNYSLELEDLERVLDHVSSIEFRKNVAFTDIILLGHSRGGGISIIKASEDARVKKVITWASVSDFRPRFLENTPAFKEWKETGITYVENSRTKQQLPHYFQFYEDFIKNATRLSIKRATETLDKPLLIIHGTADSTVSIIEAESLNKWSGAQGELYLLMEADHVFGAKHPWESALLPEDLEKAVKKTIEFVEAV